jgi:hypothetical protein
LDITEVARRSGIPASTLRFYEEKGLIASGGRRGRLRHAGVCPAPSHLECPTFRRLLRAAASGRKRKTRNR